MQLNIPPYRHCYFFTRMQKSWDEALTFCDTLQAKLVEIKSIAEHEGVVEEMKKRNYEATWLGISDKYQEGYWQYVSSNLYVHYKKWSAGNPDNAYNKEDCVEIRRSYSYQWNDNDCNIRNGVICQKCNTLSSLE